MPAPCATLRANIAAEAGALATYEALLKKSPDEGSRQALVHLATREVTHAQMFMDALKSMNKLDEPLFGDLTPDDTVDLYFNLSQSGTPDKDQPAPWIKDDSSLKFVADPLAHMQNGKG